MKSTVFLIALNVCTLVVFCLVLSTQRQKMRVKDFELNEAHEDIEMLEQAFKRASAQVNEANARLDAAFKTYSEGTNEAIRQQRERTQAIEQLKQIEPVKDWLCEPVPFDVCELFKPTNAAPL